MLEDATNLSVGSVRSGDLSPHAAKFLTLRSIHLVDVGNTLSKIESGVLSGIHSVDLDDGLVHVLKNFRSKP